MDELSTDELVALGESFWGPVDGSEAVAGPEEANRFLRTLDGFEGLLGTAATLEAHLPAA